MKLHELFGGRLGQNQPPRVGTALWLRGKELEEQARNPLKGILKHRDA